MTPDDALDPVQDGEDVRAVERLPQRALERSERTVGIDERRPRGGHHLGHVTAGVDRERDVDPDGWVRQHRRARAEGHGGVAPRVEEARQRADLVRIGGARPGRAGPQECEVQPGAAARAPGRARARPCGGVGDAGIPAAEVDQILDRDRAPEGPSTTRHELAQIALVVLVGPAAGRARALHLLHAADASEQAADRARLDLSRRAAAHAVGAGDRVPAGRQPRTLLAVAELDGLAAIGVEPDDEDLGRSDAVEARSLRPAQAVDRDRQRRHEAAGRVDVVGDRRVRNDEALTGLRGVTAAQRGVGRGAVADQGEVRAGLRLHELPLRGAVDEIDDEAHRRGEAGAVVQGLLDRGVAAREHLPRGRAAHGRPHRNALG